MSFLISLQHGILSYFICLYLWAQLHRLGINMQRTAQKRLYDWQLHSTMITSWPKNIGNNGGVIWFPPIMHVLIERPKHCNFYWRSTTISYFVLVAELHFGKSQMTVEYICKIQIFFFFCFTLIFIYLSPSSTFLFIISYSVSHPQPDTWRVIQKYLRPTVNNFLWVESMWGNMLHR